MLKKKVSPMKKKRLTKRAYVYMALVTMALVALFAKPIKKGFHTLKNRLKKERTSSLKKQLQQKSFPKKQEQKRIQKGRSK